MDEPPYSKWIDHRKMPLIMELLEQSVMPDAYSRDSI